METTMSGRWTVPAVALGIGGLFFVAAALGGQPGMGAGMFLVMAVYASILWAFGGRSDTLGVLRGRAPDERLAGFSLAATASAGIAATLVSLGGFAWRLARGEDASAFALVAAVSGASYLAALLWFQRRG
jgi:hypothetical protein